MFDERILQLYYIFYLSDILNPEYDDDDDENDHFDQIHYKPHLHTPSQLQQFNIDTQIHSQSEIHVQSQSHSQSIFPFKQKQIQEQIQKQNNHSENFKFAKFKLLFQQIEMLIQKTTITVGAALIFGIISIIILSTDKLWSFVARLRRYFSGEWHQCLLYIWLNNMEIKMNLVIFAFVFFCFFIIFIFIFSHRKFSIHNFCWVNPITTCLLSRVATEIGIGLCFYFFLCIQLSDGVIT